MGVPQENKQNHQNWVQVQTKETTESKDYWPQVFSFIPALRWELVSGSVPGIPPLKVVMMRSQCPKRGKQRAGDSAANRHLYKSHDILSISPLPVYSSSTQLTPIFVHKAKVCFLKNLKPPRTQHKTGCDSRGGPCLHFVFLPSLMAIKKKPQGPCIGEHSGTGPFTDFGMGPGGLKDKSKLRG